LKTFVNNRALWYKPRRRRLHKIRSVALQVYILSANALFSALVASTVFLLGFLPNGVLTDFKESEKIPGEIATALETLSLEIGAIPACSTDATVDHSVAAIAWFGQDLLASYRRAHRAVVQAGVQTKGDASTLRGRLMQEMAVILAKVNRIRMIRDPTFVPLVCWMANIASVLLLAGLVMAKPPIWRSRSF
jgi:hypothetical protein